MSRSGKGRVLMKTNCAVLGRCCLAAVIGILRRPGGVVLCGSAALLAATAGCSSDKAASATRQPAVGAAGSSGASADAGDGFVVQSAGTTIEPGQDVQYCEIVAMPGTEADTYYVGGIDGQMTPFSHHLNVRTIAPGSPADQSSTVGQRVECSANGRVPFGSGLSNIYLSVAPQYSLTYPEGVGLELHGGRKLLLNYHYFNSSTEPAPASAKLRFHLIAAGGVRRELRRFGMYNGGFSVPAKSSASFLSECTMAEDVQVLSLLRHTHKNGRDFTVWRSGGAQDGTPVFTSHDWEADIRFKPTDPFIIKQGEGLRFQCTFDNPLDHTLQFGELVSDEMCILYGDFVSAKDGVPALPEDCSILTSPPDTLTKGVPCAVCPDGD
jgi:hypothetical protein